MTGSTLLIFLIGVLMGGALYVHHLRHAVVAVAAAVLGLSA